MKNKITSTDIARLARVSQSTVSRAFMPGSYIDRQKKERVLEIANKLGYRPSALAAGLAGKFSKIIGLVVANFGNLFYSRIVENLALELRSEGYAVMLFFCEEENEKTEEILSEIFRYSVDGIVMACNILTSKLATRCSKQKIPVVILNRRVDNPYCNSVTTSNFEGGIKIAKHFASLGHSRVAFLSGNENSATSRERKLGFLHGVESYGMELSGFGSGNFNGEKAQEEFLRMQAKNEFTAIFAANDLMAFCVLDVAKHILKLSIPEDLAVAGFDDDPMSAWPSFSLTTIRQDARLMAKECVKVLVNQIETKSASVQHEVLPCSLVVRNSTNPEAEIA